MDQKDSKSQYYSDVEFDCMILPFSSTLSGVARNV